MNRTVGKFEQLIRTLKHSKIALREINPYKIQKWCSIHIPDVVGQLDYLNWDLQAENTWTETVFINSCLSWYEKNIALFLTSSLLDYNLASKVISTGRFKKFRRDFNIDCHSVVLIDPTIFLDVEDLDSIFISLDLDSGYSSVDLSHYDDEDNLDLDVKGKWGWLENDTWTEEQIETYNQKITL